MGDGGGVEVGIRHDCKYICTNRTRIEQSKYISCFAHAVAVREHELLSSYSDVHTARGASDLGTLR